MTLKDFLPGKLRFGTAPLGNMFRDIPEPEARPSSKRPGSTASATSTPRASMERGLAEIRLGEALRERPCDEYVVSTKAGRWVLDEVENVSARDLGKKGGAFK